MNGNYFKILKKDTKTRARLGVLKTPHGTIHTPSYVIVATKAAVKSLKPSDIKKTKTQVVISNTYHLWDPALASKSGAGKATKKLDTFLTQRLGLRMPTMTDSGGFQVFSLGFGKENRVGKVIHKTPITTLNVVSQQVINKRQNIKINDKGVYFSIDGKKRFLGPKLSIKIQEKLGADIIFAFDECTSPLDSYAYNKKALGRTNKWARECLKEHQRMSRLRQSSGEPSQILFGIIQGGRFKDLRVKSAKFVSSLPFEGIGIGGSFGKEEMVKTLKWLVPYLPEEKPRHLLGIGKVEDVFNAVENGIDMFDCVIPTREGRHGRIYSKNGYYDIRKSTYAKNKLHKLFKGNAKQKLEGQRLATIQNILFFNNLLEDIRKSIKNNKLSSFKNSFLSRFKSRPRNRLS